MNITEPYKHYTVGFYFTESLLQVALVRKCKPEWQKGLLNGVGGQIEDQETPNECMAREFMEECGKRTDPDDWIRFAVGDITCHQGPCIVNYFICVGDLFIPIKDEKEQVSFYSTSKLDDETIVPNILWLINMGLLKIQCIF